MSERRRIRNRSVRSAVRTFVKNARLSLLAGPGEQAHAAVAQAVKELDKAASQGVLHRNQVARRKSRLMHHLAVLARTPVRLEEAAQPAARRGRRVAAATGTARPAAATRTARPAAATGTARPAVRRSSSRVAARATPPDTPQAEAPAAGPRTRRTRTLATKEDPQT